MSAYRNLQESAEDLRKKQSVSRPYYLTGRVFVPNGESRKIFFVCDKDADVLILGMNGFIIAPALFCGSRSDYGTLLRWPMNPLAPNGMYAERGLFVRIYDGTNKSLTLSDPEIYMDAKEVFQPGYVTGGYSRPVPFKHYLQRDDKLCFEFINKDIPAQVGQNKVGHCIDINLTCRKSEPFTR